MGISNDNTSYSNDQGLVADVIGIAGVQGVVSVSTTAIEAKVGSAVLADRKLLTILNNGTSEIYWGYTNAVTVATGTPLYKKQLGTWDIGSGLSVWLVAASGTHNVRITEAS